jgi:hypothetical protein
MGLIKFFKELFGGKKAEDCGCDTPESCPTPEVCEVLEVPTVEVVETKEVEVPVVTEEPKKQVRRRTKAKTEKKEVKVISEKLAEVATEKKVTAKDIKGKKKSEFPIETPVSEVAPEKKSKPRRRRKPKPKTDEGQA